MVSVRVSWNRKTDAFFINLQKTKVDQNCYIDLLNTSLLPEFRWHDPGNDFEFLQDSVPSHHANVTQQFLWQNTPDFIFADVWASYSPDLNPLGYCIWDILQDLLYEGCLQIYRTSKRQSKTVEGGHHWDSSKIHCTMEKRLNAVRKQNGSVSLWLANDLMQWDVMNLLVILYDLDTQYSCIFYCWNKIV